MRHEKTIWSNGVRALKFWMAVILGIVQGVAEFLPISSSGHLSLLQYFFGMEEPDALYNILLHFATLAAVCAVYWRDVADMILEFFRGIADLFSKKEKRGNPPEGRRLVLLVILGTLPLFAVLPFDDAVESLGASPVFVSVMLLVTGCILFLSDRYGGGRKNVRTATVKDVLLVGAALRHNKDILALQYAGGGEGVWNADGHGYASLHRVWVYH